MGGNSQSYGFLPSIQEWLLWQMEKFSFAERIFLFSVVEEWKNDLQILDMEADLEEVSFEDLLMELLDEDSYTEERSYPNFEEVIRVGLNMTYYKVKNRMPDYDLFCSAHI